MRFHGHAAALQHWVRPTRRADSDAYLLQLLRRMGSFLVASFWRRR